MNETELASFKAIITGRVQGVFYRDFSRQKARELNLTGYVRNLRDGSVEVLAEGPRPALIKFTNYLREGPPHANVTDVMTSWWHYTGEYASFDVRH